MGGCLKKNETNNRRRKKETALPTSRKIVKIRKRDQIAVGGEAEGTDRTYPKIGERKRGQDSPIKKRKTRGGGEGEPGTFQT